MQQREKQELTSLFAPIQLINELQILREIVHPSQQALLLFVHICQLLLTNGTTLPLRDGNCLITRLDFLVVNFHAFVDC